MKREMSLYKKSLNGVEISYAATQEASKVLASLEVTNEGLSHNEARRRLDLYGHNEIASEHKQLWYHFLLKNANDPLSVLLLVIGCISALTGDLKATVLICFMLVMSITLRFIQDMRADKAAEHLKALTRTTVKVMRNGRVHDISLRCIAPGDIIHLSAGDMVPADVRLISSRNLYIDQASLTGESLPVEKQSDRVTAVTKNVLDLPNVCFMGTNVSSGTATAVVIGTGATTKFGVIATDLAAQAEGPTSFDRGVDRYTWLILKFIGVMVPAVFLINGFAKGDWLQAFLFALAVAVGLTPEMLPMIVTVNLSKGALEMSRKKVIVKRLNAIQDFGAMDVLCTDKTGTLTEGRVVLIRHVDIDGKESSPLLDLAYINSCYQTGLVNLLDDAVVKHEGINCQGLVKQYKKIDELPFDFQRRRMSVVVEGVDGGHLLICKGAVEEVLAQCNNVVSEGKVVSLEKHHHTHKEDLVTKLSKDGFRLIAIATKKLSHAKTMYENTDESEMTLIGFLAFLDPPKASASKAVAELAAHGVMVKVLTGDNELVTRKVCSEVGLSVEGMLLGSDIEDMDDATLALATERVTVFSKLEPSHKERIIRALKSKGHVVGFMGDGINDAPALKAADVGISVNGAVDIAKESSDIILLESSLMVLKDGVVEGRRAFGNIVKYIKMTASSNFGNMFSIVGGSIFLPFLPMLPLQVITNNLMYDLSQLGIPTDKVDKEYLAKPRQWKIDRIRQFIFWIGPVSSLYDYATFFLMLYVFNSWMNPALFHTGWFVESIFTQTLVIHVIRTNKIPFFQSRASVPLTLGTLIVCSIAAWLPYSPVAGTLGFTPLPLLFWGYLALFLVTYFILTQIIKTWFIRKYGWD
ncbi:MAG: magnesium-translocating P-type ATPase [Candidatus Uhrbacteria bacterium]